MKKLFTLVLFGLALAAETAAQSCASYLRPEAKCDAVIPFQYTGRGVATPIEWGLDLAWKDETNVRTGVSYAGKELIDIIRLSFQPTASVEDSTLSEAQLADLDYRASAVLKWCKKGVAYNLNDDHLSVAPWYNEGSAGSVGRGGRWARLIDMTADYYKSLGLTNLVSISPFNEPDYGWNQGYSESTRKEDFKQICMSLRRDFNGKYDGVRMCGGNTLNTDCALDWWNYLQDVLDEGNTHQLAGSFDNYANFFRTVREAGKHATADELHNTVEAMVGVEYGLQTGIWWGTCEYARSQFMKATYHANPGQRLGYAEQRDKWTAASIYRLPDGRVQAFGGMSERQSNTTDYMFVATDRPVWYDGQRGRAWLMHLPGGTGYQQGQTSADVCVDVQGGADVMPHIGAGVYKLMNVNSGLVAGFSSKPTSGWTSLTQRKNNNAYKYLQWVVTPRHIGGDFSYYTFVLNTNNGMYMDLLNGNYEAGADIGVYPGDGGVFEQFYLQYAGDGAFYIRNRFTNKCLEVKDGSKLAVANIQLGEYNGQPYQQWRFIPANVAPDLVAPAAPAGLTATPQSASVRLEWQPVGAKDIKSYTVLRSEGDDDFATLANAITTPTFIDNEAESGHTYIYKVYAEDLSLNRSEASEGVEATVEAAPALVMHLPLEGTLRDTTENGNDCVLMGDTVFIPIKEHTGLSLDGATNFLQLPYTIANSDELTFSAWVYYRGGNTWQRIFDFGNGTDHYLFLAPSCGTGMRFAIKNGGEEQQMTTTALTTNRWNHIVVTLGKDGGRLYLNGQLKASNTNMDIRPSDIRPALNFIGRSQFPADPLFKGYIDDVRIYSYALSSEEVEALTDGVEDVKAATATNARAYDLMGRPATKATHGIVVKEGKKRINTDL